MRFQFDRVSLSEDGDYYQVHFGGQDEDGPYLLLQASLDCDDEDDMGAVPHYLECHIERLIGDYDRLKLELDRTCLTVIGAGKVGERLEVGFKATDDEFLELRRVLGIMFEHSLRVRTGV